MKSLKMLSKFSLFYSFYKTTINQSLIMFHEEENGGNDETIYKKPSSSHNYEAGIIINPLVSFAVTSSSPHNSSSSEKPLKEKQQFDWSDKKLLVVEDDDSNYLFLVYALRKTNINIIRAVDGIQAVKICREASKIDLVLMDIQLPLKDGYDATSEIRAFKKELPIIAQTAYAQQTDRNRCLECGCNDFVTKPLDREKLILLLSKYLKD